MTKIVCDTVYVRNQIVEQCNYAINYLNTAIENINSVNSSLSYRSVNDFFSLKYEIISLVNKINGLNDWLGSSLLKIETCNSKICKDIDQLTVSNIIKNEDIVVDQIN